MEAVLSNAKHMSCSRTQHLTYGVIPTSDLLVKSPVLYPGLQISVLENCFLISQPKHMFRLISKEKMQF